MIRYPLLDFRFPDFTARHLFTAKLRLVILVGFWIFAAVYAPALLTAEPSVMLMVSLLFAVTTVSYLFILKGKWIFFFFVVELLADVATITLVIYFTGGLQSTFFFLYVLYTLASGLFYNWRVSMVCALAALLFYSGLTFTLERAWLGPYPGFVEMAATFGWKGGFRNGALLASSLVIAVYGIRLSSHFSQLRERSLEAKNLELTARNRVASATRGKMTVTQVIDEILRGVRQGLDYEASFLVLLGAGGLFRLHVERGRPNAVPISKRLGFDLEKIEIAPEQNDNPIVQAMKKKKVVIRYELAELSRGAIPTIPRFTAEKIQREFGYGKFVVVPLIAEQKTLGALVGISRRFWVEREAIRNLQGFADQAALVLDSARLMEELRQKNLELERISRAKSDFLAAMSHELRTPLNAILGFSELLMGEELGKIREEQKQALSEVKTNGENLLRLINGLLDLAKLEAGKMELFVGPVDLEQLIRRVTGMIRSLLQKKRQSLDVRLPQGEAVLYADEIKLQQVLLNLLSNAIKFTPEQGRIAVEVSDDYKISVVDNGIGIPEQEQEKIFDFFHQASDSSRRQHGTGLGLALAKQFVALHGGRIWVTSSPGQGARFTFQLPMRLTP